MKNIGIIGIGNMGKQFSILFKSNKLNNFLYLGDKDQRKTMQFANDNDICLDNANVNDAIHSSDILFLTVKPNDIRGVCEKIKEFNIWNQKIIVSTAAGVPIDKIKTWSGSNKIIRCMPNIPISLKQGSLVWHGKNIDYNDKSLLESITEGPESLWVEKEELIDSATVISGCSPAYMAYFYDIFVKAGVEMGFDEKVSSMLVKNSFSGTLSKLKFNNADEIIAMVASKGGATEEGLKTLNSENVRKIVEKSLSSSHDRIKELSKIV